MQSFESASPASISPASYFSVAFVEQAARRGRCGARDEQVQSCPFCPNYQNLSATRHLAQGIQIFRMVQQDYTPEVEVKKNLV